MSERTVLDSQRRHREHDPDLVRRHRSADPDDVHQLRCFVGHGLCLFALDGFAGFRRRRKIRLPTG